MAVLDPESVHRPSAGHSKQAHGKPRFGVSSVHGYSTCSVQKEHKDPGTTRWERAGKAVSTTSTLCFTPLTADRHTTGPQFKVTLAKLPRSHARRGQ